MSLFERAIGAVAPQWHARRALARAQIAAANEVTAHYDGASREVRHGGWSPIGISANTEIARALPWLREASRDLRRNSAIAANCIQVISSHVVGAGIELAIDTPRKRIKKRLQTLINQHLNTTAVDFDGRHNLSGLQNLVIDTVVEAGEVFLVRYLSTDKRLKVPFQVRVCDPDFLDATKSGPMPNGNFAYEGIEVDKDGRRVAYWLFSDHPGGGVTWKLPESRRVPASEVIHVYRQDRPGQMRGVPWAAPVIVDIHDLKDVKRAELMRYKIAACFAVFLKGAGAAENIGQKIVNGIKSAVGNLVEKLQPGLIQRLPQGVEAQMASPPSVQGFREFVTVHEHAIAAGFGVPHMLATGEMKEVSFISGRLGLIQFSRNVDQWRWFIIIPHACDGIFNWFIELATIVLGMGDLSDVSAKWTPPRREMVEPSKEVPAMRDAIRSGLSSRQAEVRSLGEDPERIDTEQAQDNERSDKLKLQFDSDGRKPLNWKPTPAGKADGA